MRQISEPDPANRWRLETPGPLTGDRSPRPDAANKYFMVSTDGHVQEPADLWSTRLDKKYRDRAPGVAVNAQGDKYQKTEGFRPLRIRNIRFEGEDLLRNQSGITPEQRRADLEADGVNAEILFPNKGLTIWATPDAVFSQAMCRVYNDWAWEVFAEHNEVLSPMACIAAADIEGAVAEVKRTAALGFRGLALPCKPVWGPPNHEDLNYNLPEFDPLWAVIQDTGLPMTFHVSTGRDPRTSRGNGGAVINYAVHSLAPTMEPIANLCASGVLDRFPGLQFGSVEAGIGWVAWALQAMDEAYRKHHMFVRPQLKLLPSEYFRRNGFATFQEDKAGVDLAREHDLTANFMWANDYPHHEGTWPHSAQAIERTMVNLSDPERAAILGLNAARVFGFRIPDRYLAFEDARRAGANQ
ncbi:MAG: amidohydrolase family protein [Proteobacteria bacterium]|jgi:predicted TIM-barrel fold metal-dependent hydrolase|nr:amidohydrolase family protein [Pseudomonadota bacterium]MDA1302244.1 amidohydrolase family protein [Pseudomonadota bacterium]